MQIAKIGIHLAVLSTPVAASVSFAQDGEIKANPLRAEAIHTCSTAAAKFLDYSWGNTEMFVYRARMTERRERE